MNANEKRPAPSKPAAPEPLPLFTIGDGARSLLEFIATLTANRIEFLLDVRSSPYSKFKPEFSKEIPQSSLERARIRYLFMGDTLGGQPKDPACVIRTEKSTTTKFGHSRFSRRASAGCAKSSSSTGRWP